MERPEGGGRKVCWDREGVAVAASQGGWHDRQTRLMVGGVAQQSVAAEAVSAVVLGSGMPFTAPLNAGVRPLRVRLVLCIFCKSTSGPFTTREHILPESLGGDDWAILPDGLFCDQCQNRFGSSIEQQALADYPFSLFRVLLGIPTKKGKAPWLKSWEGIIAGTPQPGVIGYDPSPLFKDAVEQKRKTVMRILAHPLKPDMVCRTLLKMGIEIVATDGTKAVFDSRFDDARNYALLGKKTGEWWYLQTEDLTAASQYFREGITPEDCATNIHLETILIEDTAEVFHLKLLYLDLFTPLEARIQPPSKESLQEPEYRLFMV